MSEVANERTHETDLASGKGLLLLPSKHLLFSLTMILTVCASKTSRTSLTCSITTTRTTRRTTSTASAARRVPVVKEPPSPFSQLIVGQTPQKPQNRYANDTAQTPSRRASWCRSLRRPTNRSTHVWLRWLASTAEAVAAAAGTEEDVAVVAAAVDGRAATRPRSATTVASRRRTI